MAMALFHCLKICHVLSQKRNAYDRHKKYVSRIAPKQEKSQKLINNHRLRHRTYGIVWGPHLGQHFIQPLQRPMQVHLDPTGRARDVLSMVLRPPALNEAHPDGAHLRQFVNRFESVVDALGQQLGELRVVEDSQRAPGWYFADRRGVEAVMVVAVAGLYKNCRV
jgi:hypothetical protein